MNPVEKTNTSSYISVATLNKEHNIDIVQDSNSGKIYVRKILSVFNLDIYKFLLETHPAGIPWIYELWEEDGHLIVIEEYISGNSLAEYMSHKLLSLEMILGFSVAICTILEQLHAVASPIVHRDIKPSNVIVSSSGTVYLIDFNAAKFFTDPSSDDTVLLGTHGYAAPEQYGFGSSLPQSDIYAMGVLIKELLSSTDYSSTQLDKIIECCTRIDPKDRYSSVSSLKKELLKLVNPTTKTAKYVGARKFLPPGFRSLTPWKMIVSSICYAFITILCLNLKVDGASITELWINRAFVFIFMLSEIATSANYLNVHSALPLCRSKKIFVRIIGVLLLDILLLIVFLILLWIIENLLRL